MGLTKTGIYIAGPMTGLPEFNFPAFHQAEQALRASGFTNIGNPAAWDEKNGLDTTGMTGNESGEEIGFDLRAALKMDLSWIADNAFAVALLPGWEDSKGTAAEIALAKALGLQVAPLVEWVGPLEIAEKVYKVGIGTGTLCTVKAAWDTFGGDCTVLWDEDTDEWLAGNEVGTLLSTLHRIRPRTPEKVSVADLRDVLVKQAETTINTAEAVESLTGEVRVVSATGGEKGRKAAELGTIDPLALLTLAEVSGFGARKYAAFNYLKGYDWSLSFNAMTRHLLAFWNGEDNDPESGLPHITHAAWHGLALTSFQKRGLGTDDRYKGEEN